jgi:enoyl-CoA hydratase/carnithine racemase
MATIRIERAGAVRTVTMTRPEKRNAMNLEMLQAMQAAFSEQPHADERVTVLRGEGRVFCSGLDLTQDKEKLGRPEAIEKMLRALETYPLPVLGIVHGDAIAGGNELALHCDFVVASAEARFAMPLAQIGLSLTWFLAKKLLEVGGPVATREFLFLGDRLSAQWMFDHGLIARVAPSDQLEAEAAKIVDRLAANAPLSLKTMKKILVREMAFRDHIEHADLTALVAEISGSADAAEGIAAMMEKRKPRFRGV